MPWAWELDTARYRDSDTGRFLSAEDVRELALERVRITGASTDGLANMLVGDQLNVPDWETLMRQSIKDQYIQEYQLGRGGLSQMTQEDWGSIGGMLADQYRYLKPFAQQIADEDLSEAEIARRSRMYIHSSREAFSRATARAKGWPELPSFPADGSTVCLCITTPESQVLTGTGWRPIGEIRAGDVVFTHRGRWRTVLKCVIKPSLPGQQQAWMIGPTGEPVGCTASHRWLTGQGWLDSNNIDNSQLVVYHLPKEVVHEGETVRKLWGYIGKQKQTAEMYAMCQTVFGMPLRQEEGLSSGGMSVMRKQQESKSAVGREQARAPSCCAEGPQETTYPLRAFESGHDLADQARWPSLDVVLDTRRTEGNSLSLSVGLAEGERSNSERARPASHRRGCEQRQPRESRIDDAERPCKTSWRIIQGCPAPPPVQDVWPLLSKALEEGQAKQLLFGSVLPTGTALYDIVVEEDHSYIIEGLVSHNTNCQCHWQPKRVGDGWEFTWVLDFDAEHCTSDEMGPHGPRGCIERADLWNPLVIKG